MSASAADDRGEICIDSHLLTSVSEQPVSGENVNVPDDEDVDDDRNQFTTDRVDKTAVAVGDNNNIDGHPEQPPTDEKEKASEPANSPDDNDASPGINISPFQNILPAAAAGGIATQSLSILHPHNGQEPFGSHRTNLDDYYFCPNIGIIDQAHSGSVGQISRPGAYPVEGPNIGIEEFNTNTASISTDHSSTNYLDDADRQDPNLPVLEATPVCPVEATISPLYEATIIVSDTDNVEDNNKSNNVVEDKNEIHEMVMKVAQQRKRPSNNNSLQQHQHEHEHELQLSNIKLHGREDDMNMLAKKLVKLTNEDNKQEQTLPELVLIAGVSGTGKSALVMKGVRDPAQNLGLTFVGGKFDLNNKNKSSMPLSAFVDAMVSLTNSVAKCHEVHKIQYDIYQAFGEDDIFLLVRALPGCEGLFPLEHQETIFQKRAASQLISIDKDDIAKQQYETLSLMGKAAVARLQYKIRRLLQIICTHLQGLVLFIDDLQWADTATIDLLQSISLDSDIPSLLMIGAYRDDEVVDTHPLLALQISEREQLGTIIKIGNLTLADITSLLSEIDMEEGEELNQLASIVQKKTEGNAFFVLTFLRSLYDEKLLQFNCEINNWIWNDDEVNAKVVTSNVANILIDKLNRLEESEKSILKIASCLGGRFCKSTISTVITALSVRETEIDWHETLASLDQSIGEFKREGLWEEGGTEDAWYFSHDKIQLVAFELIPTEQRDSFQAEIGSILLEKLDLEELETNIFQVVSLRNCAIATLHNDDERKELARLNLRAGMKASDNAAFDSAAVYFKAGREVFGLYGWDIDQHTMLKLCSDGANSCFICGDLDTMHELIAEVISQDIPIEDKFNVYEVRIQAAHAAKEFNQAIDIALDFRQQLGLPTVKNKPANQLIIIKEFIKTSHALGNKTAEDIASLPDLIDDRIVMGQRMLELLCTSTSQVEPTMFPLIVFLMIKATFKYGINASSCDAFGSLAMLLCGPFGKLQEGRKMLKALDLTLIKPGMERMKARSIFVYEGIIHHWTSPLQDTLEPLLEGYQIGLRTGDVESAGINLAFRINHLYYTGRPLKGLEHEIQTIINAMIQMNQTQATLSAKAMLLGVKKLLGETSDLELKGIIEDATERGDQLYRAQTYTNVLDLKVFFKQWDEAASLLEEAGDVQLVLGGLFTLSRFTFVEGLISIQSAKSATTWLKKRTWKKRAIKSMKRIRGWIKKGNVNLVHYLHLLEAEYAALQGKCDKAESNYKSAVDVSSRDGFIQDCALSHELASAYYSSKGDMYWKNYHMEQCKECYSEWGAIAKVESFVP